MKIKQYTVIHSEISSKISPEKVWNIWKNVNSWPTWDNGLEYSHLPEGSSFETGQSFLLRPKGVAENLTTTILDMKENQYFKDRTSMPLGIIEVTHNIEKVSSGFKLTHKIEAKIYEEKIPFFESTLLSKWKNGLHTSIKNIILSIENHK